MPDLTIPKDVALASEYEWLVERVEKSYRHADEVTVPRSLLTDEMLAAVEIGAKAVGNRGFARLVASLVAARAGDFSKSIPRLAGSDVIMREYLAAVLEDGWLYRRGTDGHLHAWLVTDVGIRQGHNVGERDTLEIRLAANGKILRARRETKILGLERTTVHFDGDQVVRKKPSAILESASIYVGTPEIRAEYEAAQAAYFEMLDTGFAKQYRYDGTALGVDDWKAETQRSGKVIHDAHRQEIAAPTMEAETSLYLDEEGERSFRPVPAIFAVPVFDLQSHDHFWANARDLTEYVYDPTLREKIVLPDDQRNLLDILTSNLDDFVGDVIEGKSAGNVVLCKGLPGVGKTLTAEVYAELIERPLYSIHSGNLGVQPDEVRTNLERTFKRAKRWSAVLLLDEADVFVLERGTDITQNAIVAEFLRTLEYFDGLMFMTTNRADNIDDAILSRAAAIIDYPVPDLDGIREVWLVQSRQQGADLDHDVLEGLVGGFKTITPRDVKMLLRLALRVSKGNGIPLDIDVFERCAMFRGLHFSPNSRLVE